MSEKYHDHELESTNSYTHHTSQNFTLVQNDLIRSSKLSCKAFKLLCIGLSHSGKWIFNKTQIATCFKEGKYTVDEAMKELRSLGYLHLKAKMGNDNRFSGHNWFWFDKPISEEEFKLFLGNGGFQGVREKGGSENIGDIRRPILKKTNLRKKSYSSSGGNQEKENRVVEKRKQEEVNEILATTTHGQKAIYWKLLKLIPKNPDDNMMRPVMCARIAKNNIPHSVECAILVYNQDYVRCERRGAKIDSMEAYIIKAINDKRIPMSEEAEENRQYFYEWAKGKHQHIFDMDDKYVVFKQLPGIEVPLNMDKENFKHQIDLKYQTSLEQRGDKNEN